MQGRFSLRRRNGFGAQEAETSDYFQGTAVSRPPKKGRRFRKRRSLTRSDAAAPRPYLRFSTTFTARWSLDCGEVFVTQALANVAPR
jgi:hypothetical protein